MSSHRGTSDDEKNSSSNNSISSPNSDNNHNEASGRRPSVANMPPAELMAAFAERRRASMSNAPGLSNIHVAAAGPANPPPLLTQRPSATANNVPVMAPILARRPSASGASAVPSPPQMTRRLSVTASGIPAYNSNAVFQSNDSNGNGAAAEPSSNQAAVERLEYLQRRMTQKFVGESAGNARRMSIARPADIDNDSPASEDPFVAGRRGTMTGVMDNGDSILQPVAGRRPTVATIGSKRGTAFSLGGTKRPTEMGIGIDKKPTTATLSRRMTEGTAMRKKREEMKKQRTLLKRLVLETADETLMFQLDENAIHPFIQDLETDGTNN